MPDPVTRGRTAAVQLRAAADELLADVRQLPPELINWQPAEGVWTVMDILCHVQEFVPFWTSQVMQIVEHPDREWGRTHADTDRLAAVHNTAVRSLADVQRAIDTAVTQSAAALDRLSDAALSVEAPSRNPRWGVKPASFIVGDLLVQHVQKHLGQVRRNVSQYQERPR